MLWQRLLTALLLVPLVVAGVLLLDSPIVAAILAAAILVGAYEMARLAKLQRLRAQGGFMLLVAAALWLGWRYLASVDLQVLQWAMTAWWTLVTVSLVARRSELARIERARPTVLMLGGLVLVMAWLSIVTLHARSTSGPALVLYLFVLIWVADSAAYFTGRAFGRRKLSPFVSPGKTWAGAVGALGGAVISALLLSATGVAGEATPVALIVLSVLVAIISIGGDLWESRLKREAGVKDSGRLLPGHGGMLDRIDSLLAAAPVFALGAHLVGAVP